MAILYLKFDNILCFNEFEADFTYPKRLINSTLENEFLQEYPNIRYRKVNVIIGSNSTGKTSLGRAIWGILLFLHKKESGFIKELVSDQTKPAYIMMDSVYPNGKFFRLEINIFPNSEIKARYIPYNLKKDDSYPALTKNLDKNKKFENYIEALEGAYCGGWNINFPSNEDGFDKIQCKYDDEYKDEFCELYNSLIRIFDPSVKRVFVSSELTDTFVVEFYNGFKTGVTDGDKLSELMKLSSGTKNVINIAGIIFSIKKHFNGLYYVDEQFSFVDSDIEKACLTLMTQLLGDGEQLFFTTHNRDVMDTSLPIHSYNFLRKIKTEDGIYKIEFLNASKFEKRNNVNVRNLFNNDVFNVAPDTYHIHELGDN